MLFRFLRLSPLIQALHGQTRREDLCIFTFPTTFTQYFISIKCTVQPLFVRNHFHFSVLTFIAVNVGFTIFLLHAPSRRQGPREILQSLTAECLVISREAEIYCNCYVCTFFFLFVCLSVCPPRNSATAEDRKTKQKPD